MKYKILQLDEHGRISFSKEELEKLLDEVYEEGRRDGYGWRYYPYITYTSGSTTGYGTSKKFNDYDWTITCDNTAPSTETIHVGDSNVGTIGHTTVSVNKTE